MYRSAISEQSLDSRVLEIQENSDFVHLEDVSSDFSKALVAVEDWDFYDHGAVKFSSIVRAYLMNLMKGDFAEGGSTITQQVAKNLCFSREKSYSRKVAELFAARELERKYTKDEILEIYMNMIYYGDGYMGVGPASRGYFNIEPSELSLYEATLLAGLPQAPSVYALSTNSDRAAERQKQVIDAMVKHDVISEEEAETITP